MYWLSSEDGVWLSVIWVMSVGKIGLVWRAASL